MRTARRWLWILLLVAGLWFSGRLLLTSDPVRETTPVRDRVRPVDARAEADRTNALVVELGSYIENLHDFSLRERTFTAEGFYWLKWPVALQRILEAEGMSALDLVELANQVSTWDASIQAETSSPVKLDGSSPNGLQFYQLFRYSANLYIPDVDLRRSPFERLTLPVLLEVRPELFKRQRLNIVLVPDRDPHNSLIGAYAGINGYDIEAARLVSFDHSYGTDWGLDRGDSNYSQVAAQVVMHSDPFSSFVTWVLPLIIVMAIVLLAPSLGGELGDIRLAIPSTALLTLIFLQQAYKSELPLLSYLTFLDHLYAYSYLTSLVLFVLFLWGSNVYADAGEATKGAALARINRVDTIFQRVAFLGFFVVALLVWRA